MKNLVILIGNLGKDPETRTLENGNSVTNFPVATSETYNNKQGEKQEKTEWHNIVFWGKLAEIADKYLKKGSQVYIEGKIQTRTWEDKEGNTRYSTEIVGHNLTMLGGGSGAERPAKAATSAKGTKVEEDEESDLPF